MCVLHFFIDYKSLSLLTSTSLPTALKVMKHHCARPPKAGKSVREGAAQKRSKSQQHPEPSSKKADGGQKRGQEKEVITFQTNQPKEIKLFKWEERICHPSTNVCVWRRAFL